MSTTINCDGPLVIDRGDNGLVKLTYKNFELRIYRHTFIPEIYFRIIKGIDSTDPNLEVQLECGIELCTEKSGTYEFKYPYDMRELASTEFDRLVQFLKPMMKSPSNTNKI